VVFGLTFSNPPADVCYALSLLAGLVVTSKFTFFNMCIGRADTATNAQTSPMLDVIRNPKKLRYLFFGRRCFSHFNALAKNVFLALIFLLSSSTVGFCDL